MVDYILAQGCDINETDCRRMYDGVILPRGMFDFSNHLLDKVAALGNVELFDYLVARGADPQRSSALHRVSVCHGKQKSLSMLSSLIDRHKLDISANLYEGYNDLFDYGPENGTPLCSAVYNHNLPVAAELLRRGAKNQDLTRPVQIAIGGYCGIEYQEPALILLIEEGGFDFQRVLSEAVGLDQISAAKLCLERGADASHTLREQILEDELSLAQDLNPPSAVGDIKYHRKMSDEMRALLEQWKSRVPGLSDNTK
jgi:ankyrin repeat protein